MAHDTELVRQGSLGDELITGLDLFEPLPVEPDATDPVCRIVVAVLVAL
jgi:hypothetical protein